MIIDCDGSTWGARTAVAVDLVVLRCSSGAATYRVRAAKVRMYNARRVCAVRVAAALEHYKNLSRMVTDITEDRLPGPFAFQ